MAPKGRGSARQVPGRLDERNALHVPEHAPRHVARRRGAAHLAAFLFAVAGMVTIGQPVAAASSTSSTLSGAQGQATRLAHQIVADGAAVQHAVEAQDAAQTHLDALNAQITATRTHLAVDRRASATEARVLRRLLVAAYTTGQTIAAAPSFFALLSTNGQTLDREYSGVASSKLHDAILTFKTDEAGMKAALGQLRTQQAEAAASVVTLTSAVKRAQGALAQQTALLNQVKANIAVLKVAAALQAQQRAAQEAALAAQRAAAQSAPAAASPPSPQSAPAAASPAAPAAAPPAAPAAASSSPQPQPLPTPAQPAPSGYANPLRSVSSLYAERIDQGVDYSGYGPVYAAGDGVVLSTANSGWPGGTFIAYRLTNGPASGDVVYLAEDVQPLVQVGQNVTPTTVLGNMYEGPDGIETGWADPSGQGSTMAWDYNQFNGSNSTAFGANFSQMLASVGAPPGVLQNTPPTGSLPPGWPTW